MRNWDELEGRLNKALDEAFAESWLFCPMGEGDIAGPQPDTERDERQIRGVFAFESEMAVAGDVHGIGKNAKFGTNIQTGMATLSIEHGRFLEPPRQGDHFRRLGKLGKPLFRAVTVHENGLRIIVTLQEL